MSIFSKFATDASIQLDEDSLGKSKFGPWDSGAYDTIIDMAYVEESKGGAVGVNMTFKTQEGKELKQTIYVTTGKEKGQTNYYMAKDGTKRYLPGFTVMNDICLLATAEELSDLETETKMVTVYDYTTRKDIPMKKEVLVGLIGKEVTLGVTKVIEDKFNSPGETRVVNNINKVFRTTDQMTTNEIRAQEENATFYAAWVEKNTGIVVDKSTGGDKAAPMASVVPADKPRTKSLFSK